MDSRTRKGEGNALVTAGEEIAEQVVAGGGENALRVELHAFNVNIAVANAHHDAV